MKVLVNEASIFGVGRLVAEAYTPEVGWALGTAKNVATMQPGTLPKPRRSTTRSNAR